MEYFRKDQSINDIKVLWTYSYRWAEIYILFTNKQLAFCKIPNKLLFRQKWIYFLRNKYLHIYLLPWSWKAVRWSVPIERVYIVACSIFSLKVVVKVIVQKSTQTRCLRHVGDGRVNFNIYKPTYTSVAVKHNLHKCACWQNYLKCLKHAFLSKLKTYRLPNIPIFPHKFKWNIPPNIHYIRYEIVLQKIINIKWCCKYVTQGLNHIYVQLVHGWLIDWLSCIWRFIGNIPVR